ncbi:MAG: putative Fe-S cluster assembly protein SufT [Deltaproteobacteria bacterium]|nr:putative Fe-S cluster assembly protein SufT [Deltaproteobacteria bacterium]
MHGRHEKVVLSRSIPAIQVPSGEEISIAEGTSAWVMQQLGGTITIRTDMGEMARVSEEHADALGLAVSTKVPDEAASGEFSESSVWGELRSCYDPEIPVNVVELGLIYGCAFDELPDGEKRVRIQMTLTAPGCGMGDVLQRDIRTKLGRLPGVGEVDVEVVMDPPWSPNMMSEEAKLELGFM